MSKNSVILILGPAGAGKSTICKELAKKFKRSVVIETDKLRDMVKMSHVKPWEKGGEAELLLATKNTSVLAKNFLKSKYIVIIEDVVIKKSRLDLYLKELKSAKVKIILLLPSKNTLKHRDGLRSKEFQLGKRALDLHDMFTERLNKEKRWSVLDTSNETVLMTTKRICDLLKIK
jgi:adenylate kinase family enzyme